MADNGLLLRVGAGAGAVVAIIAAWFAINQIAPWAKPSDVAAVRDALTMTDDRVSQFAGISVQTAIYQKQDILIRVREAAARARKVGDASLLRTLLAQIQRLELEIRRLEAVQ